MYPTRVTASSKRVLGEGKYRTYKAERKDRQNAKNDMDRSEYEQYKADNPFTVFLPGENDEVSIKPVEDESSAIGKSRKRKSTKDDDHPDMRPGEDKKAYAKRILGDDYGTYKEERRLRKQARDSMNDEEYVRSLSCVFGVL